LPKYLYYHFLCDAINEKFRHVAKGVGIHHLGAEGLSKWMINVPPIDQQNRIILEIERLFTIADQMEKSIDQSLRQAARLRQAILQRAFTGKL
jgi:type I restriction enzyme S subunit